MRVRACVYVYLVVLSIWSRHWLCYLVAVTWVRRTWRPIEFRIFLNYQFWSNWSVPSNDRRWIIHVARLFLWPAFRQFSSFDLNWTNVLIRTYRSFMMIFTRCISWEFILRRPIAHATRAILLWSNHNWTHRLLCLLWTLCAFLTVSYCITSWFRGD